MAEAKEVPGVATCATHRRRPRVTSCASCGNGVCSECLVPTSVGVKCRKCTGVRSSAPVTEGGTGEKASRWARPVLVVGLVLALVGGFTYLNSGGGGGEADLDGSPQLLATAVDRPVTLDGEGSLAIGATLTLPAGAGGDPVPSVLIIPGGGTIDRNTVVAGPNAPVDNLYEDLSLAVVGAGMAALRYDPRGTGTSVPRDGSAGTYESLVTDARSGVDFLAERREVAGAPLFLVGYDRGGLIALRIAASDPRVTAVVLVSTPGRPLVEVVAGEIETTAADPGSGQEVAGELRQAVAQLLETGHPPPVESLPPEIAGVFDGDAAFLREVFSLDPVAEASGVTAPVLIIRGVADTAITEADVEALDEALTESDIHLSDGGNTLAGQVDHGGGGGMHGGTLEGPDRDIAALTFMAEWLGRQIR